MTPTELKSSLKALGLTYQALADLLTSERQDGKVTSASTISNQANGKHPVDPALALYLRERLKAREIGRSLTDA